MTYYYKRESLPKDIYEDFCYQLYRLRCERRKTLDQVMVYTGIPVLELDRLECAMADIDFRIVAKLLKYYDEYLIDFQECFPNLSPEYKEYFITDPREILDIG